jgi:hypothetical protein
MICFLSNVVNRALNSSVIIENFFFSNTGASARGSSGIVFPKTLLYCSVTNAGIESVLETFVMSVHLLTALGNL